MKRSLPSMIAGLVLVIFLVAYMVTYQVRSTEVAVVATFGKTTPQDVIRGSDPDGPGLRFKWPWPIQSVTAFDNRVQTTALAGEEISTADKETLIVSTAVGWRIADPYQFSVRYKNLKTAENDLKDRVRNDQKTIISKHGFNNFVSVKPGELRFDDIEKELLATVRPAARELYGIEVESVRIEKLALPPTVTTSVFNAMKKERQALADRYTSEGNSEAEQIKKEAESIANTILSFADQKAAEIIAEGQAAANVALATLGKDEPLAIFLMKLESLAKMLKDRATVIMDTRQEPLDLMVDKPPTPRVEAPGTRPAQAARIDLVLPELTAEK
ncbi:MAG: protease modulator HflC [Phycisphaerae bacterium]|jgi:membrane protease subunit HflC